MSEFLDIVNENGLPTGRIVERSIAHMEGIWHRTSHVWLVRRKEEAVQVLLQKRTAAGENFVAVVLRRKVRI